MNVKTAVVLGVLALGMPTRASGQNLTEWIRSSASLSAAELARATAGQVVTKLVESADPKEVAVLGLVRVGEPLAQTARSFGQTKGWLAKMPGRTNLGFFSAQPSAAEAGGLVIEPDEIKSFKKCRVGSCDIKLPSSSMRAFQESIDFSAQSGPRSANAVVRARLAQYAFEYMKQGDEAMVEYADDRTPLKAAEVAARLRAESASLLNLAPALKAYLEHYPAQKPPGSSEEIYWSVDQVKGMKPVVGLTQAVSWAGPESHWLVEKQLYANHFFGGALTITVLGQAETSGSWLLVVRRLRFDKLPSGGILNIKGRVTSKVQESLAAEMAARRSELARR